MLMNANECLYTKRSEMQNTDIKSERSEFSEFNKILIILAFYLCVYICNYAWADPEGGTGGQDPPPEKITKL